MRYLFTAGFCSLLLIFCTTAAFAATIGGSVTNNSGQAGRIFLRVFWNNGGPGHWGVSIPSAGAYAIRGVQDGIYVVAGFIDKNDDGIPNSSEATALSGTINISGGTVTGDPNLTFSTPASAMPVVVGNLVAVGFDGSVLLFWDQPENQNGAIEADSYQVEWSTNNFASVAGSSLPFDVGSGMEKDGMYLVAPLTNGQTCSFRVKSIIGAQTVTSNVVSATPNAPSQGYSISGAISLPGNIAVPADTPIISMVEGVGGAPFLLKVLPTFANGTTFTVGGVPNGYYHLSAFVDMDKDNRPSAGDYLTNAVQVTINGTNVTGQTLTVAALKAIPSMEIDHVFDDFSSPNQYYGVQGYIEAGTKRPVNIYITGPAFTRQVTGGGVDLAWDFDEAGYWQWDDTRPQLTDQYSFQVEYSDGTPGETLYTSPLAVYDSPVPNNVTPGGNITAMPANITWTPSAPLPPGWVVEVSIWGSNSAFRWEPATLPAPTATSVAYDGPALPVGLYNLRVQFCEDWDWGCVSRSQEFTVVAALTPVNDNTEFVKQVYRDFLNREADAGGLAYWVGELDAGRRTKAAVVEQYLLSPEFGEKVAPVTRLYFAYFNRLPDYSGLMYWVDEYASGRRTLYDISNAFAASAEFQTAYGSLDNGQFVDLIYTNLFGRAADPAGRAYWVGELDAGRRTRGEVMVLFSDASEYKNLMANPVYVTMTYIGLLRRSPDQGGYDYWVGQMDGGRSGQDLISGFLASLEYQGRFTTP